MQKIQYITNYKNRKSGDVEHVSNNVAHGLIEVGVAVFYADGMFRAPRNTMMKPKTRRRKRGYRIK